MCKRLFSLPMAVALLFACGVALAAGPYGYTGRSWDDPPLRELLTQADLVAECRVIVGGQFRAIVRPVRVFKGEAQDAITVEGFNSYEWNTAYYAMREGDVMVLALFTPGGPDGTYTLAAPSAGRFPLDKGRVLARLGKAEFLVEIPVDDFRSGLEAYFIDDTEDAARSLGRMLSSDSLETRYLAIVLLGELHQDARELAAELLSRLARDRNPAIREAAARALGRSGGQGAAKALATFLTDADRAVARAAAEAVVETASPGAGRELVAWLSRVAIQEEIEAEKKGAGAAGGPKQDDYRVQGEAFQFLADGKWLKGASEEERHAVARGLVEMIASVGTGRARLAARVLGLLGVKEAVPGLIRLLGAESEAPGADGHGLREEAGAALVAITLAPETAERTRALGWWEKHGDEPRRRWVERGLGRAAAALRAGTYDGDIEGRLLVAVSRDPLAAWAVRKKLAEGTGWDDAPLEYMKGPLIAPFAERALAVGTSSQRLGAAKALAGLVKDLSPLQTFHDTMHLASHDTDSEVRSKAVEVLGLVMVDRGGWGSIPRLLDLLEHGSGKSGRTGAAESLRKVTRKRFGFYVSRSFDLKEELRGLDLWREWWRTQRAQGRPAADGPSPRGSTELAEVRRGFGPAGVRRTIAAPEPQGGRRWEEWFGAGDPETMMGGVERLVHLQAKLSDGVAEETARSDNPRVRAILAAAVGLKGRREHAGVLTGLLDDPEPIVRVQAAWAVGNSLRGTGEAPRRLVEIAREALPEKEVEPEGATDEPVEFTGEEKEEGVETGDEGDEAAGDEVLDGDEADITPSVVGPWPGLEIEKPRPPLEVLQAIALAALGKIGGADSLDCLREAVTSGGPQLRREAAAALAHFPGGEADDLLCAAVTEADSSVRRIAARVLAMRRPPGAAEAIARAIAPVDYWDSYTLMDTLVAVAGPEDSGALAEYLTPGNETASIAAAHALTRNPGPGAAEGLVNALETCGWSTRHYAARALLRLGKKGFPDSGLTPELRARATKALVEQLSETESLSASYAAQALEQVGVPGLPGTADALFIYRRAWRPQDPRSMGAIVRLAGERGLRYAFKQLKDGTWSDKYYTLQALHYSVTGPAALLQAAGLYDAAPRRPGQASVGTHGRPGVKRSRANRLTAAPADEAVAKLIEFWRDPESPFQAVAARSLRRCGMPAVEAVAKLLGEEDAGLRRRAAWLLGGIGREMAEPGVAAAAAAHLERLTGSDDPVLVWLARREIAALTGEEPAARTGDETGGPADGETGGRR